MKNCRKCGLPKPLAEFYDHPRAADGRSNKCKECTKSDVRKHRADNIDRIREYDRSRGNLAHRVEARASYSRTDAYRESHSKSLKRYREEFPERRAAQVAVGNALRDGVLVRQPCFVCGDLAEAHHPNYDAPLDVVWLCIDHHKEAHAIAREVNRQSNIVQKI